MTDWIENYNRPLRWSVHSVGASLSLIRAETGKYCSVPFVSWNYHTNNSHRCWCSIISESNSGNKWHIPIGNGQFQEWLPSVTQAELPFAYMIEGLSHNTKCTIYNCNKENFLDIMATACEVDLVIITYYV